MSMSVYSVSGSTVTALATAAFRGYWAADPPFGEGCYLTRMSGSSSIVTSPPGTSAAYWSVTPGTTWRVVASAHLATNYGSIAVPVTVFGTATREPN
jgi:hypothetical protein